MVELIERAAGPPDRVALADADRHLTWAALERSVSATVGRLVGLAPSGLPVAVCTANRIETFVVLLAALHCGVEILPLNTNLTPGEAAAVLRAAGSAVVVVDETTTSRMTQAAALVGDCQVVDVQRLAGPEAGAAEDLLPGSGGAGGAGGAGGLMLHTSGSTGTPRLVRNGTFVRGAPLAQIPRLVAHTAALLGVPATGTALLVGPWYHSAQLFMSLVPLLRGMTLRMHRRFDATAFLSDVDAHGVRFTHLVPTQMVRLLRLDGSTRSSFDGSSLERVWHGGGPCSPAVKSQLLDWWGPVLHEYYGATEAGVVCTISPSEWEARPTSVGRPIPGVTVTVVDDEGGDVDPGLPGRLCISRADGRRFSYVNARAATRTAEVRADLMTFGDLGHVDTDGFVHVHGRDAATIVTGGVNVSSWEIESVLLDHPSVADAVVRGVPDVEFGQRIVAEIEPTADVRDLDEFRRVIDAHCRARLAGFKVPRAVTMTERVQRDDTGKLRRGVVT